MSKLLKLAQNFNSFYLSGYLTDECLPFIIEGEQVGLIRPNVLQQLLRFPEVFHFKSGSIELNPAFRDYEQRTLEVDKVLKQLRKEEIFVALKGWRDECYEVKAEYVSRSFLKMDRSATCLFGIKNYGVSINGYVRHPTLGLCVWLQKRSSTKQTWPGKWDNMVSGGLAVGLEILESAYKEAKEEASLSRDMMKNLRSSGCVSFFYESERGLFPNTEYVFDLELPIEFNPVNLDGEVECFDLLPTHACLERMFGPDFKTSSAPVLLDFLIRHGFVTAENETQFLRIIELLHVPLQRIYTPFRESRINTMKHNGAVEPNNLSA